MKGFVFLRNPFSLELKQFDGKYIPIYPRFRAPIWFESDTLKYSMYPRLPHGTLCDVPRFIGVQEEHRSANVARNLW